MDHDISEKVLGAGAAGQSQGEQDLQSAVFVHVTPAGRLLLWKGVFYFIFYLLIRERQTLSCSTYAFFG